MKLQQAATCVFTIRTKNKVKSLHVVRVCTYFRKNIFLPIPRGLVVNKSSLRDVYKSYFIRIKNSKRVTVSPKASIPGRKRGWILLRPRRENFLNNIQRDAERCLLCSAWWRDACTTTCSKSHTYMGA